MIGQKSRKIGQFGVYDSRGMTPRSEPGLSSMCQHVSKQSLLLRARRVRLHVVRLSISWILSLLASILLRCMTLATALRPCDHRGDDPDHSALPEPHLRGETTVDQPSLLRHAVEVATSRNGLGSDSLKGVCRLVKYALTVLVFITVPSFLFKSSKVSEIITSKAIMSELNVFNNLPDIAPDGPLDQEKGTSTTAQYTACYGRF